MLETEPGKAGENRETFSRRDFAKATAAASAVFLLPTAGNPAVRLVSESPIRIILPPDYIPPLAGSASGDYTNRLIRAVLDFLAVAYKGRNVPIWHRAFETIDFEKRVARIVPLVLQGVQAYRDIYPIDPAWVMAQMMHESYFNEFTVSRSLAVGLCQFVNVTAGEYGMLCAGDLPEHGLSPFQNTGFASKEKEYQALRRARRRYSAQNRSETRLNLEEVLQAIVTGNLSEWKPRAEKYLAHQNALQHYDERIQAARENYRQFILANIEGRDAYSATDLAYLASFDERLTFAKPIFSMIKMLARALRARSGNIMAAAAAYNAGLSTTIADDIYKPYGKIPGYDETITYLSRILVLHHEIATRLG